MSTVSSPTGSTFQDMPSVGVTRNLWTREDYYRLGEQGWCQDSRVELIEGEIITKPPEGFEHYSTGDALHELLKDKFGAGFWVRPRRSSGIRTRDDSTGTGEAVQSRPRKRSGDSLSGAFDKGGRAR